MVGRARKPSDRANRHKSGDDLLLTPLMDIITNLMFFLLIFANLIPVVTIDAPLPKVASTAEEIKLAKDDSNRLEVSVRITQAGFLVSSNWAATKNLPLVGGKYNYTELHRYFLGLHRRKPKAREMTVIPEDNVIYDVMIQVMDEAREVHKKDPGYKEIPKELKGRIEGSRLNDMFPNVSIGGV